MIPLTPLEQGGTWATDAEMVAFLIEVEDQSRVTGEIMGVSGQGGFLLRRFIVTDSPDPSAPVILVVGGQHGYEPASREGALRWLRDLAYTTDPEWLSLLQAVRFIFIPDASPWASWAKSRITRTADNIMVDMNRDHLLMQLTETVVVQETIKDFAPVFVIDMHEHAQAETSSTWRSVLAKVSLLPEVDNQLKIIGQKIENDTLSFLTLNGIECGTFPQSNTPDTLNNTSALRNSQCMLIETPRLDHDPLATEETRATLTVEAAAAAMKALYGNIGTLVSVARGASGRATALGAEARLPFVMGSSTINPPPISYTDLEDWPWQLDILGVSGDVNEVQMGQPARALIPYLLDPLRTAPLTRATRNIRQDPTPEPPEYAEGGVPSRIRMNYMGVMADVSAVKLGTVSGTVVIWP